MAKSLHSLLAEVWRWLPVFRAAADTESVSRAAEALGITPPAVSRTIRQLEESIGRDLFDRGGGKLTLNADGDRLHAAVREAEESVRAALGAFTESGRGVFHLATMAQLDRIFLLPAVQELTRTLPKLQVSIALTNPDEGLKALETGTVELFLGVNVAVGGDLRATRLHELPVGVFAGQGHPLFERKKVSLEEIQKHPFVAQRQLTMMKSVWPRDVHREVGLIVNTHALGLESCLAGSHLMVMEVVAAAPWVARGELRELKPRFLKPAQLVLCTHVRSANDSVVEAVGEAIRGVVASRVEGLA